VLVGAADSVLGAYGLGVRQPGPVAAILGTSAVLIAETPAPVVDSAGLAILTPTATGGFAREIDLLALGSAISWLGGLFDLDAPRLLELAGTARLADAPLVLPFLAPGEQGIRWDPCLSGQFAGLSLRTSRAELALGLVAGLVHELSRGIALLSPDGGPVLAGGSVASSAVFRQALADATGREVHFDPAATDSSTIGAARFAAAAIFTTEPAPSATGLVTSPDPDTLAAWQRRAARQEAEIARPSGEA
jgi:sugar (pentulose or hexulose) kinase